jgi:hypothetical protein
VRLERVVRRQRGICQRSGVHRLEIAPRHEQPGRGDKDEFREPAVTPQPAATPARAEVLGTTRALAADTATPRPVDEHRVALGEPGGTSAERRNGARRLVAECDGKQWLRPLLEGQIRSAFSMTEPLVASSDATNIATRIERDGDHYVINGRKWWTSGAMSPRCELLIVMGVTSPEAAQHRRQSMILVPRHTPGVRVERSTSVFGHDDGSHGGHAEISYDNVRVPAANLLGEEGSAARSSSTAWCSTGSRRPGSGSSRSGCSRSRPRG